MLLKSSCFIALLGAVCLSGTSNSASAFSNPSKSISLKGNILFKKAVDPKDFKKIIVQIRDTSLADGPAPVIAKISIPVPKAGAKIKKIPYRLLVLRARVKPRRTYTISARIEGYNDKKKYVLLYLNDTAIEVLNPVRPGKKGQSNQETADIPVVGV